MLLYISKVKMRLWEMCHEKNLDIVDKTNKRAVTFLAHTSARHFGSPDPEVFPVCQC